MHNHNGALRRAFDRARTRLQDEAEQATLDGHIAAARDADRLEAIATRLVGLIDQVEPEFDRLDVARDDLIMVGPNGQRRSRTPWPRGLLCVLIAESFDQVLSPGGMAVLSAAVRAEAGEAGPLSNL